MSGERGKILATEAEYSHKIHLAFNAHREVCTSPILYRDQEWREFSVWNTRMSCPNCGFSLSTEIMSGKKAATGYGFVSWKVPTNNAAL